MLCQIRKIKREELDAIKELLKKSNLPFEDIDEHAETFLTAKVDDEIVGVIGLEIWNENALLRSLAVKEKFRNDGIGKALYEKCIELAKQNFITTVALLTTTAETYFEKNGFVKVTGNEIPQFIKETKEFKVYCPSSSTIMIKKINGNA